MAKDKRERKAKRSLLASLFEPAEGSETGGLDSLFDDSELDDDEELVHLFDDDEVEYSDEQDEAALNELTWSDGERVVDGLPERIENLGGRQKKRRADADTDVPERRARRSKRDRREKRAPERRSGSSRLHTVSVRIDDEPLSSTDTPANVQPSASTYGARPVQPPAQPPQTGDTRIVDAPGTPNTPGTPGTAGMDATAFLRRNAAPSRPNAIAVTAQPPRAAESGTAPAPDGEPILPDMGSAGEPGTLPTAPAHAGDPAPAPDSERIVRDGERFVPRADDASGDGTSSGTANVDPQPARVQSSPDAGATADDAPIRLFDDADDTPAPRPSGNRSKMFRTGSGMAARIQMHETETLRSIEDAKRRQREKDAAEQHAQYVRRQKRREKRKRAAKRMAANIAFVAFIIIAVLVALYYTFLLRDIVVTGNDTYSDEYIIGLTGLQYGRHMLFCDLDAAERNIAQDPYLQVDAVDYIFPARVRIQITERKEVAGIIGLDYNVIIDHNGYVLSMGGGTDLSALLQVTGVGMTGFQVGERLGQTDDFGTATLVTMIRELETYDLIDDIASLDLTTPLAIVMHAKNGLKIHVGQPTELSEKLLSLRTLLPQFISANIGTGTLYLSARGGTVYSPPNTGAVIPTDPETGEPLAGVDPNLLDPNAGIDPNAIDPNTGLDPNGYDPNTFQPNPLLPGNFPIATPDPAAPPTPNPLQPGGGDGFQG